MNFGVGEEIGIEVMIYFTSAKKVCSNYIFLNISVRDIFLIGNTLFSVFYNFEQNIINEKSFTIINPITHIIKNRI